MADAAQPQAAQLPEALGRDGFASRVFLMASSSFVAAFAALCAALWTGKVDGAQFVEAVQWLVTSVGTTYGLANVGQRLAGALGLKAMQ